ncbi:WXG100 family type VII secretion target [Nocardioides sp.]|uniref:WXG100 family type VII secretion target n=1 Tax=Nocardioides sp. TaxID=35761 RepID=UPI003514C48E
MSFDGLRVNHAELDAAAQNMYATVQKLDETLNNLESDIAPKVATWSGSQQESYRSAKAAWDRAMQEMRDLLAQSKQSVDDSNADYAAADRRGADRFSM